MKKSRSWFLFYIFICAVAFSVFTALEIRKKYLLLPLIKTGGIIESSPAIIYAIAAILAFVIAWHNARKKRNFWGWTLYGIVLLFMMGEESAWGGEPIFGWQLRSVDSKFDIHNWFTSFLESQSSDMKLFLLVAMVSVVVISFLILIEILRQNSNYFLAKILHQNLNNFGGVYPYFSAEFLFVGFFLIIIVGGSLDSILPLSNLSSLPLKRLLEELSELLGSIALLFVPLQALYHAQNLSSAK